MSELLGKKIKLFTLSANRELAQEIADLIKLILIYAFIFIKNG